MPNPVVIKKRLDKDSEPMYKDEKLDKPSFYREEVIEILKLLKGIQRKLQKKLK